MTVDDMLRVIKIIIGVSQDKERRMFSQILSDHPDCRTCEKDYKNLLKDFVEAWRKYPKPFPWDRIGGRSE